MTAAPVLMPRSTVCTSIDGLWMLTMLLIRPGTAWLMLYCSASRTLSALRYGDPGGNSVITPPPCRMGCGASGASVAAPGLGTPMGAGRWALERATESANREAARSKTIGTSYHGVGAQ